MTKIFEMLYNSFAIVFLGLMEADTPKALKDCGTEKSNAYFFKGRDLNEWAHLREGAAYWDDLDIICITNPKNTVRVQTFKELVDINAAWVGYHPVRDKEG